MWANLRSHGSAGLLEVSTMKFANLKSVGGVLSFLLVLLVAALVGRAQYPQTANPSAPSFKPAPQNSGPALAPSNSPARQAKPAANNPSPAIAPLEGVAQPPATPQSIDAEREQIWNSPSMLRARAWLQEYCDRSAKITPAEKQQYMTELANLTPVQMKLWLLKFDEQEEARRQQEAYFQQTRANAVARARSVDASAQQAYAAINQGETAAANNAEQQLNMQAANQATAEENKSLENAGVSDAYGPYGYNGYGGYGYGGYGGYGGIQYHFHFHPY
jgi:hypothetical protein